MNFVEHMSVPLGLTAKHNTLDNIFYGLLVIIILIDIMIIILTITSQIIINIIMMKIIIVLVFIYYLFIYLKMSKIIAEYHHMFNAIVIFENHQYHLNKFARVSIITFILIFLSSYYCLAQITLSDEINKIFVSEFMPMRIYEHGIFTQILLCYFIFYMQFIYFEFCNRYYNVLIYSNNLLRKYLAYKPDPYLDAQLKCVLDDFVINQDQFNSVVKLVKYYSLFILITYDLIMIMIVIIILELDIHSNAIFILIIYFLIFNFYSIITKFIIHFKSNISPILIDNINSWRKLRWSNKNLPMIKIVNNYSVNSVNLVIK